ncbi:MAG: hypothetical protein ACTHKS_13915 [Gaiellaceae bacterium]
MLRTTIVLAIGCLVLCAGVAIADSPSPYRAVGAGTEIRGIVPTKAEAHAFAGKGGSGGNLTYHGGPVLLTNRTFAIYWAPSGSTLSTGYQSAINQYFTDVAHDSGSANTNVYSVEKQYYNGSNQFIAYNSTFGGSYIDTQPYPANGCSDTVSQTTSCLSDSQLQAEIQRLFNATGAPIGSPNATTTYFLFTAKNVGSCFNSSTCAFSYYCAYHSNLTAKGVVVQYANQPYADTVASACDAGYHPNSSLSPDADATINVTSHEHRESINDPLGNAWYDRRGAEGSDKCAWNFGTLLGADYNQVINSHHYLLQQEWSNTGSTCKLHA